MCNDRRHGDERIHSSLILFVFVGFLFDLHKSVRYMVTEERFLLGANASPKVPLIIPQWDS